MKERGGAGAGISGIKGSVGMIRPRSSNSAPSNSMLKRDRILAARAKASAGGPSSSAPPQPPAMPLEEQTAADPADGGVDSCAMTELCESASLSFAYRKKRQEQLERQNGRRSFVPADLAASKEDPAADDASCVSGLSDGSGSTKGSRASAASRASGTSRASRATGAGGPPHVRDPFRSGNAPSLCRHPLYLLKARRLTEDVQFSGGMGHDECAKFYKLRKLDYVVEKPKPPQRQKPNKPVSSTPPATAGMSPAKRAMVERLRKMEAKRRQQQQQQRQQEVKMQQLVVPKEIEDTSDSTLSTIGLDESLGSLNDSQHSYGIAVAPEGSSLRTKTSGASKSTTSGGSDSQQQPRRRPRFSISFSKTVSVHRIPSAQSYPANVFESVWYTKLEWNIQKRVCRLELMSDGSDWRTATEEGDYVQCPKSGKAVHPVHVKGLSDGRRIALGNNPMKLLTPAAAAKSKSNPNTKQQQPSNARRKPGGSVVGKKVRKASLPKKGATAA